MIALQTERLRLRSHRKSDLPSHYALMSDPEVMYFLQDIMCRTTEQAEATLAMAMEEISAADRTCTFLCVETPQGERVGEIGYTKNTGTPAGKVVTMGYFFNKRFWGKGYATEALAEVLRFAFEEDGVYRVCCGCNAENTASERVMQRCGFTKEAHFKDHTWLDGTWHDRVEYRMLRPEWEDRQKQRAAVST